MWRSGKYYDISRFIRISECLARRKSGWEAGFIHGPFKIVQTWVSNLGMKQRKSRTPSTSRDDLSFNVSLDIQPLISEGKYEASFIRAERKKLWGGIKVFLWFRITTPGEPMGEKLYLACNLPQRITNSSKYYRCWVVAAGRKPTRHDRMSTSVFRNKIFEVSVRTVKESSKQRPLNSELQYSVVDEILEVVAGWFSLINTCHITWLLLLPLLSPPPSCTCTSTTLGIATHQWRKGNLYFNWQKFWLYNTLQPDCFG